MYKFWAKHFNINDQEEFSFENVYIGTMHKCMLQDTVPGTVTLNMGMFVLSNLQSETAQYFEQLRFMFRVSDMIGLANAAAEIFYQLNVLLYKTDGFVYGKLVGKLVKVYVQFKLIDFTQNYNYYHEEKNDEEGEEEMEQDKVEVDGDEGE